MVSRKLLLVITFFIFGWAVVHAEIIYVKQNASGIADGSSWQDAFITLSEALDASVAGDSVFVARGVYTPGTARDESFVIKSGVQLFGHFEGNEPFLSWRKIKMEDNKTVLSGDIGVEGDISDNSYHVVKATNVGSSTVLNGFTIIHGNAVGAASPYGGGLFIDAVNGSGDMKIRNCKFIANQATDGGAVYVTGQAGASAQPELFNVVFRGNYASNNGGAVHAHATSDGVVEPQMINCSMSGNRAGNLGGGFYSIADNYNAIMVDNTILYNNKDINGTDSLSQIYVDNGSVWLYETLIEGGWSGSGTSSFSFDPQFVQPVNPDEAPTVSGDLHLKEGSMCVDSGATIHIPTGLSIDLDGNKRIKGTSVDLGAYEGVHFESNIIYVDKDAAPGLGDGSSWAEAVHDLMSAIQLSSQYTNIDSIFVAAGEYWPDSTDPSAAFPLMQNTALIGHFAGTESYASQRDLSDTANQTILSGHGLNYSVLYGVDLYYPVLVDGFTITKGYNLQTGNNKGGGIKMIAQAYPGSPVFKNCIIQDNYAHEYGGGVYMYSDRPEWSPMFINCQFKGNKSAHGGAICHHSWQGGNVVPAYINCVITGNHATDFGGGIYNYLYYSSYAAPEFLNTTVAANRAYGSDGKTGGMYTFMDGGSTCNPVVKNSIFALNTGEWYTGTRSQIEGGTPEVYSSCIEGGWTGTGSNNIDETFLFVSPRAASQAPTIEGDYHLKLGSQALDAGNNTFVSDLDFDYDNAERIQNAQVDMGAYEGANYSHVVYVKPDAMGDGHGGTWQHAFTSLHAALDTARNNQIVDSIFVAKGVYKPHASDRTVPFSIPDNVVVMGHFNGDETHVSQRDLSDPSSETILSGDIDGDGTLSENSYRVVYIDHIDTFVELNGLTIRDGYANTSSGGNDRGAGLSFMTGGYNTICRIANCKIINNEAIDEGGAIYVNGGYVEGKYEIVNTLITGNKAKYGGALYAFGYMCDITGRIVNTTIAGNYATETSGGLYFYHDVGSFSASLSNSIIYENKDKNGTNEAAQIYNDGADITVSYSCIQNWTGGGTGNIAADPMFHSPVDPNNAPTTEGDYRLVFEKNTGYGSPAVDAGNNDSASLLSSDILGQNRVQNGVIDMGVYEGGVYSPGTIIYVDQTATGGNTGYDWENAINYLQDAIHIAKQIDEIDTLFVAGGTYKPTTGTDRTLSFEIPDSTMLFGHFAGTENTPAERELNDTTCKTILSGDIDGDGTFNGNTYSVVKMKNVSDQTVMDGFTITGGNSNDDGGGVYNLAEGTFMADEESSPVFRNCIFDGNRASQSGGGFFNDVYDYAWAEPTFINCVFSNNATVGNDDFAGAGFASRTYNQTTTAPSFIECTFIKNHTPKFGGGFGAYGNGTHSPVFDRCLFTENSAEKGGASYFEASASSAFMNPRFGSTNFFKNEAVMNSYNDGGALMFVGDDAKMRPSLIACSFKGNKTGTYGYGGAIFFDNATNMEPFIASCMFSGNAGGLGGAIYAKAINGGAFINNTVTANKTFSITRGGGIDLPSGAPITIRNSIFYDNACEGYTGNSEYQLSPNDLDLKHCIVEGGYTNGVNVLDTNPDFIHSVDPTLAPTMDGDYHLKPLSPANGAGYNSEVPDSVMIDIDGDPRIKYDSVDIGADEVMEMPPVFMNLTGQIIDENQSFSMDLIAKDRDSDPVSYFAVDIPDGATFVDSTFAWEPTYNDSGSYSLIFMAVAAGDSTIDSMAVQVVNVDRAPVFTPAADQNGDETDTISFTLSATDPDGDPLTYSAVSMPDSATLNGADFEWITSYNDSGSHEAIFKAEANGLVGYDTVIISIENVDRAPVFTPLPLQEVKDDHLLSFDVEAIDPDGDPVSYTAVAIPTGAGFVAPTFEWTPGDNDLGNYQAIFKASSNAFEVYDTVNISVVDAEPPVFSEVPDQVVDENDLLSFMIEATDGDNDPITYSAVSLPDNASLTGQLFEWQTDYADSGNYQAIFEAEANGFYDYDTVRITVNQVDAPPVIEPIPDQTVDEGDTIDITINSWDPDSVEVYNGYEKYPMASGSSYSGGHFWWYTGYSDSGTYELIAEAKSYGDNGATYTYDTVLLTVNNVDRPPEFDSIGQQSGQEGDLLKIALNAVDPDGDAVNYSAVSVPVGVSIVMDTLEWTPGYDMEGVHEFIVSAESNGLLAYDTISVMINNTDRPPVFSPTADQVIDKGDILTVQLHADDPEGDSVSYSGVLLPGSATVTTDGLFEWQNTHPDTGIFKAIFEAEANGLTGQDTIQIEVNNIDLPPVISFSAGNDRTDSVEVPFQYTWQDYTTYVTGSDPEGQSVTTLAVDIPDDATYSGNTFTWKPDKFDAGVHELIFSATANGLTTYDTLWLTVINTDKPPYIEFTDRMFYVLEDNKDSVEVPLAFDENYVCHVEGYDPENAEVTIEPVKIPATATYSDRLEWEPQKTDAGTYEIVFSAEADGLKVYDTLLLTVINTDKPPFIEFRESATNSLIEGNRDTVYFPKFADYACRVTASDPEGAPVELLVHDVPSVYDFSMPPYFHWDYSGYAEGTYHLVFSAEASGTLIYDTLKVTVIDTDNPPFIEFKDESYTLIPDNRDTVLLSNQYNCNVSGDDPDYDIVTVSIFQAPSGASMDMYGNFSWLPGSGDAGMKELIFSAESRDKLIYDTLMLYVYDPNAVATGNQMSEYFDIHIYPVPADKNSKIVLSGAAPGKTVLSILDMNGRFIRTMTFEIRGNSWTETGVFTDLPPGEYIVKVNNSKGLIQKTIVVK